LRHRRVFWILRIYRGLIPIFLRPYPPNPPNPYLKAFNAYLLKSVYTGTSIGTSLDDTTTGISTVEAQTTATDGAWFSLDGKRLDSKPARKGIYVKDGKKVVVK